MREFIETVIAPRLQGDGGWVEFIGQEGEKVTLLFRGECSKCGILDRCTAWIEGQAEEKLGERITIVPIRKKPFFWDT